MSKKARKRTNTFSTDIDITTIRPPEGKTIRFAGRPYFLGRPTYVKSL